MIDLELKVKVNSNNSEVQVGNYFVGTYENGTLHNHVAPMKLGSLRMQL